MIQNRFLFLSAMRVSLSADVRKCRPNRSANKQTNKQTNKHVHCQLLAAGGAASGGADCFQRSFDFGDTSSLLLVEQPPAGQIIQKDTDLN